MMPMTQKGHSCDTPDRVGFYLFNTFRADLKRLSQPSPRNTTAPSDHDLTGSRCVEWLQAYAFPCHYPFIEHVKEQAPAVLTSANECLTHKSHYTTQARESS